MRNALLALLGLATVALIVSLAYWSSVPDPMPTHWGIDGRPDGYGSRAVGLLLMPAIMLGLAVLTLFSPGLGDTREDREANRRPFGLTLAAVGAMLLAVHILTVRAALTPGHLLPASYIGYLMGALLMAIGAIMPSMRPNGAMGIRVPWTRGNPEVWVATHRFAGVVFILGGLALMPIIALLPPELSMWGIGGVFVALVFLPIGYAGWRAHATRRKP